MTTEPASRIAQATPLNRRDFLLQSGILLGGLATASSTPWRVEAASESVVSPSRPGPRWFEQAWRRAVIDMHIPDWD